MKSKIAEISEVLKSELESLGSLAETNETGRVITVGDGIARAYGLDNVQAGETVEFASGAKGLALNLEQDSVGIVIMGNDDNIRQGDVVKRTGEILQVKTGKGLLGRVVDGFGDP